MRYSGLRKTSVRLRRKVLGRDEIMGVLLVIFGVLAIAGGVLGNNFQAADVIALGEFKQKSSRWSGRLVFVVVGVGLIGIGIKMLLGAE